MVTQRLDSYQDPRVQPILGLGGWELASPSPPQHLDLWEPSQPLPQPPGPGPPDAPRPSASGHFPLELRLPWGLSVKAHSPAPQYPEPLSSTPRQGQ